MKWSKFRIVGPKPKPIKLPAQKSPSRFSSLDARDVADKAVRKKFGQGSDFITKQGMQTVSVRELAAESYAGKVRDRVFTKNIFTGLKTSRKKTATFIKGASSNVKASIRPKKVTPKFVVPKVQFYKSDILSKPSKLIKATGKKTKAFDPILRFPKQAGQTITGKSKIVPSKSVRKAKSKGAMKSLMTAQTKSDAAFTKITERYTTKAKASPFKNRTKPTKRLLTSFEGEKAQSVQRSLDQGYEPFGYYSGMSKSGRISKRYAKFLDRKKKK
jgi:hypothetical protein